MTKSTVFVISAVAVMLFCVSIEESFQTHVSKPVLTTNQTVYSPGDDVILSGWVSYNETPTSDVLLTVSITDGGGTTIFEENITSLSDGTFSVEFTIPEDSELGRYQVDVVSQCREVHRDICTNKSESMEIMVKEIPQVPEWVRNIFVWFGQDKISENELLKAIEFLINQNIIKVDKSNG